MDECIDDLLMLIYSRFRNVVIVLFPDSPPALKQFTLWSSEAMIVDYSDPMGKAIVVEPLIQVSNPSLQIC